MVHSLDIILVLHLCVYYLYVVEIIIVLTIKLDILGEAMSSSHVMS